MAVRFRIWGEAGLGAASSFFFVLTLVSPSWIETLSGASPDHGSGILEWLVSLAFAVLAVGLSLRARNDWRRVNALRRLHVPEPCE
jgi:hypothetical protein